MEYLGEVHDRERHTVIRMTKREYDALKMLILCTQRRPELVAMPTHRQDVAEALELACRIIEKRRGT